VGKKLDKKELVDFKELLLYDFIKPEAHINLLNKR